MRKTYFGLGTALSNRKSVQPSVKIVSVESSSATGPSAGVLALEMTPVNRSILPSSFIRRSSLTLASVPAFSSAVIVSIWRLPREPALGVDLVRRHGMALERGFAEHRPGAGQQRHVAYLEWRIGNPALRRFLGRLEDLSAANHTGAGESRPADGHAQAVEKATTTCG